MNLFYYGAKSFRVIDGDTLDMTIDLGFGVMIEHRVRLYGINTPESHGRTPEPEKSKGIAAKDALTGLLHNPTTHRPGKVIVQTHKIRRRSGDIDERTGKYGRYMVSLWIEAEDGTMTDVNRTLVESGHANLYTGGKRPKLGTWRWDGEEQLEPCADYIIGADSAN
jgi:micrococcal nuclease